MRRSGLALLIVSLSVPSLALAQPAPSPGSTQPTPTPTPTPTPAPTPVGPPTEPAPAPTTAPAPAPATTPAPTPAAAAQASDVGAAPGTMFGVGVHAMLTGVFGPAIVYNQSRFHIEGILAFANAGGTDLAFGGRFWFHAHQTKRSSLSVGGGLAFASVETEPDPLDPRMDASQTNFHLEGGAQIRFFATDNVALSASLGLGIIAGDGDLVVLTGQLTGGVGLTYFIF